MRSGKVATWKVDTVEGHMRNLQHDRLALLKIDVEGFEWIVLREALSSGVLEHVDQLLFEVHLWTPGGSEADRIEAIKKWHAIFAELEEVGFKLFYVHTNPLSSKVDFQIGFQLPCCFEVGRLDGLKVKSADQMFHLIAIAIAPGGLFQAQAFSIVESR